MQLQSMFVSIGMLFFVGSALAFMLSLSFRNSKFFSDAKKCVRTAMWLVLTGVLFLVLSLFVTPTHADERATPMVSPPQGSEAQAIIAKVNEAEVLLAEVQSYQTPLRATHGRLRIKGKLVMKHFISDRPVVLAGYRGSDRTWHIVHVHAHSEAHEGERVYTYTAVTPGYTVDRLSGRGIARLIFDLTDEYGEHIPVYRMKHLSVPEDAIDRELPSEQLLRVAEAKTYTPYHPDFEDKGLSETGMRYLKAEIRFAQEKLRETGVRSLAFPELLLADAIPWEIPMALSAIEQMDDEKFRDDEKGATSAIYAEYALNGPKAFRYSVSVARAVGALQFTDKDDDGTYSLVVRRCKGANLDSRFPEGAEDLHNVIKAAICLLDIELANLSDVKPLFERKPLVGGIYPVAAYNGGHGWAVELYKTLKRDGVDLESEEVELPSALSKKHMSTRMRMDCCGRNHKRSKRTQIVVTRKIENKETAVYVQKYVSVINFLEELVLPPEEESSRLE